MKPNQSLLIQLVNAQGEPLDQRGVAVDLHFFVKRNWRYVFRAGKTDSSGQMKVTYERLEGQRQEQARLWLMDCNTRLEECDSRIRIELPSKDELAERMKSVYKHHPLRAAPLSEFSTGLKKKVPPVEIELDSDSTQVNIVCD